MFHKTIGKLNPVRKLMVYLSALFKVPPIPLAVLHFAVTLITIQLMPPPPEIPFLIVPLVWGASLSTTVVIHTYLKGVAYVYNN